MKRRLTIKSRLFFAIATILVSSYTILFFLSILSIQRINDDEISKDLENSLRYAKSQFNARPEMVREALNLPVSDESIQKLISSHDPERLGEAVKRWGASIDFLEMLTITDAKQNVIARRNGKTEPNSFLKGPLLESMIDRREPLIVTELITHERYCEEVSSDVCQALPKDTGLTSIMIKAVMCGCWDTGRKKRPLPDTGHSGRSG